MAADIDITIATTADLPEVVALLTAQFGEHHIDAGDDDAMTRAAHGLVAEPSRGAIFLASRGGMRVGIAVVPFTWTLEHGGQVAWLEELYVVPSHREAGIGSALLAHVLSFARETGCLAIDLEVDAGHARVEGLYERHGFVRLPRSRWALRLRVTH